MPGFFFNTPREGGNPGATHARQARHVGPDLAGPLEPAMAGRNHGRHDYSSSGVVRSERAKQVVDHLGGADLWRAQPVGQQHYRVDDVVIKEAVVTAETKGEKQ